MCVYYWLVHGTISSGGYCYINTENDSSSPSSPTTTILLLPLVCSVMLYISVITGLSDMRSKKNILFCLRVDFMIHCIKIK